MSKQVKYRQDYCTPDYTITDISLDVLLDAQCTTVKAISTVKQLNPQASTLVLDGEDILLTELLVDGKPWADYSCDEHQLVINHLPANFTLSITNTLSPEKNSALEGLYVSDGALCTQCEAEGFRRITYYLDRPDVLARFTTTLTADKLRYPYLLSNGNRIEQGELDGGKHWVKWQDPFPKPSYLFALVAGDLDCLRDTFKTLSGRDVTLELYVDKGNLNRADWAMASLKNAMRWDEERFGLEYDLDIYMIVAVDFFNMGAMENKGLNIFNSKYVLANTQTATDKDFSAIESVIGHEYFHNWTGNRVTCRDWFQLSLKEGLTVFRDQEFSADLGSRGVERIKQVNMLRNFQFAEDASPMAHPIRPEKVMEMNNFYTVTVYEKGAEVIRMMHTLLGEEGFQAGMRLYFQRHDGQAATCDDFVQAMQDASGVDLTQFKRWYSQSGTPCLYVSDAYDASQKCYTLTIKQITPPTQDQPEKYPLYIPVAIALYRQNGEEIEFPKDEKNRQGVLILNQAEQKFVFNNLSDKPIPSLLQGFSAPVKLDYNYTDDELMVLIRHAKDDFARADAARTLVLRYVHENVKRYQQQQPLFLSEQVIDVLRGVLLSEILDPALMAEILFLPTEVEMGETFEVIDVDAIHEVRSFLAKTLAEQMQDEWLSVYLAHAMNEFCLDGLSMGKRAIRSLCLVYLGYLGTDFVDKFIYKHYLNANNMTDKQAALNAAMFAQLPCLNAMLIDFEKTWQHDGLVMDKWFAIQAVSPSSDVLASVRKLMLHPIFSMSNPNRIRSLIGSFVMLNPFAFHAKDGQGYAFLEEILTELNQSNPQTASRLIEPLIKFKRYDSERQQLMHAVLNRLNALPNLSSDLAEKIAKALNV